MPILARRAVLVGALASTAMSPAQRQSVLGGAAPLHLSFLGGVGTLDPRITFTRASVASDSVYTDAAGSSFTSFISGAPKMTSLGLLSEFSHKNNVLNSGAPATQTTASLALGAYILWLVGTGTVTSSAGTAVGSGFGVASAGTPQVITITTAGTVVLTVAGSVDRFQLENGTTFATSYIPTTGATVTRSADVATMPVGSWYNPAGSTMLVAFRQIVSMATSEIILSLDGSAVSTALKVGTNNQVQMVDTTSGLVANLGAAIYGATCKAAFTFRNGLQRGCINGGAVSGNTLATMSSGITTLAIANALGIAQMNGWIQDAQVWPRTMSDGEMQARST